MNFLAALLLAAVVDRDVPVRMRDGVVLRADVYRPAAEGRHPTLVYRTPYDRKRAAEDYTTIRAAVARGYAVVAQDVRGRYGSDGEFVPYFNEGRDGYDTIEWAAAQPWSDGDVGTFGLSYPGAVQWLAAVASPPHLKAMVPAMTFSTHNNFIYSGGVFDMSWTTWIWDNIAPDVRRRKDLPGPRTGREADETWRALRATIEGRLPLSNIPEFRDIAPYLFDWMKAPPGDPGWAWMDIRGKYERTKAAVLNLSGWYDGAYGTEGAATNHLGLVAARRGTDARSHLVLGPWIHGSATMNARRGQIEAGERSFGTGAGIDYDELILRFMDRHVRGLDNGLDREKPVRVFVMGENAWREEDTLAARFITPSRAPPPGREGARPAHAGGSGGAQRLERFRLRPARSRHGSLRPRARRPRLPRPREAEGRARVRDGAPGRGLARPRADHRPGPRVRRRTRHRRLAQALRRGAGRHRLEPHEPGPRRAARELPRRRTASASSSSRGASTPCPSTTCSRATASRRATASGSSSLRPSSRTIRETSTRAELETVSAEARKAEVRIHHDREHPSSLTLTVVP